jgi:hypothetical protein
VSKGYGIQGSVPLFEDTFKRKLHSVKKNTFSEKNCRDKIGKAGFRKYEHFWLGL